MAGDWIKLEIATPDKPEVYAMSHKLGMDRDALLGKLVRLFIWYDQHLQSGNAICVSDVTLCAVVGNAEFAQALREVGWLREENGSLLIPNFDRHNGKPAKQRALIGRRVANFRNAQETPTPLAREEKRREEKKTKAVAFEPPAWVPLEAWKAYNDMRARIRKPFTDRARELAVAKLAHLKAQGHDPLRVLEQSVLNAWAGLFELKAEAQQVGSSAPGWRAKPCKFCSGESVGMVNGISHCREHTDNAMFGEKTE